MPVAQIDLKPESLKTIRELLKAYVPKAEVWAYGSRVDGTGHDASDLDLALRNTDNLEEAQEKLFELREALRESNVTILVDVLDWARMPARFHREIEKAHVVLQSGRGDSFQDLQSQ